MKRELRPGDAFVRDGKRWIVVGRAEGGQQSVVVGSLAHRLATAEIAARRGSDPRGTVAS